MTQDQFADWKTEAARVVAREIHSKIETEKDADLESRTMLGRAIADKLWTHFEGIVDERAPAAVKAVLDRIAAMKLDDLVQMFHNLNN